MGVRAGSKISVGKGQLEQCGSQTLALVFCRSVTLDFRPLCAAKLPALGLDLQGMFWDAAPSGQTPLSPKT